MLKMKTTVAAAVIFGLVSVPSHAQLSQYSTRSLLQKKIYYVSEGKIGEADFWALHFGDHGIKMMKYFPGDGKIEIDANVNFSLLSSAYIEGAGYSSRGKIQAAAELAVMDGDSVTNIEIDSIDYVTNYGRQVKLSGGEETDLILYAEDMNRLIVKRMQLRQFYYDKTYGELKHDKDIPISAFAFSKQGAFRALKALQTLEKGQN
jgi:hypothetical protein